MIVVRIAAGLLAGAVAAVVTAGVIFAWGNAFVMWPAGWGLIAPFIGALCGCVVAVWATRGTHGEPARRPAPRPVPVIRNPPMSAQGLRLLNDVSTATIAAQRAVERPACRHCGSGRLVARGPVQPGYGREPSGPWRRWRCADCGGEMDRSEPRR